MKLIMTGEKISAQRAQELRVVQDIYPQEQLHEKQLELAGKIAKHSLYSLALLKESVRFSAENSGPGARLYETSIFHSLYNTKAKEEGVGSFLQKRKPDFTGM